MYYNYVLLLFLKIDLMIAFVYTPRTTPKQREHFKKSEKIK